MKAKWILALAAGATVAAAMPDDAYAQGRSAAARQRQEQRQDERDRERERDRLRAQREQEARILAERRQREEERARLQRQTQARVSAAEARRRELERERLRNQRDGRYYDDRYDPRDDRRDIYGDYNRKQQKGPAFCRSGQGHPVHGREWCRQKGFGLGSDRWERERWDDVIFRDPRRRDTRMGRSTLEDILGGVILGRFESYGRQYSRDPLVGYWVPNTRSNELMLSVGDFPIARLVDLNRDGRVDNVFLWR